MTPENLDLLTRNALSYNERALLFLIESVYKRIDAKFDWNDRYKNTEVPEKWHGQVRGYTEGGCRCRDCTFARSFTETVYRRTSTSGKAGRMLYPANGSIRRLQALMWEGWSGDTISEMTGLATPYISKLVREKVSHTRYSTTTSIKSCFKTLIKERPPEDEYTTRRRRHALKLGWLPWTVWEDIDDPDCKPDKYDMASYPYDLSYAKRIRPRKTD